MPSTSALAKEYDIFVAAAAEILKSNLGHVDPLPGHDDRRHDRRASPHDGISCLLGKPPTRPPDARQPDSSRGASDPTTGQEIAVATLLAAAHTSE